MDNRDNIGNNKQQEDKKTMKEATANGAGSTTTTGKISGFSIARSGDKRKMAQMSAGFEKQEKEEQQMDYVEAISGNQLQSINAQPKKGPLVIPMQEQKTVKIKQKYLNLVKKKGATTTTTDVEPMQIASDSNDSNTTTPATNETATATATNSDTTTSAISEPVSIEQQAIEELLKEARGEKLVTVDEEEFELPLLLKYRNPDLDEIADEDKRFKVDVESRPDEASLEDYEKIPVEKFGSALLRGMGWKPGGAIGLTNAKAVQPVEFVQRPGYRTGLGATVTMPEKPKKKYIKPGESREDNEPKVLPLGPDGQIRYIKGLDEKLVPLSKAKGKLGEGSFVSIIEGRHDGMYAVVLQMNAGAVDRVKVRLEASGEVVTVDKSELSLVNQSQISEDHPAFDFIQEQLTASKSSSSKSKSRDYDDYSKDKKSKDKESSKSESSKKKAKKEPESWLFPNIIVRIISKSFADGKYYLKKGKIIDVISREDCTLQLLDSKKLLDVKQRMLETVIPAPGEKVLFVEGKNKGKIGKLMSKTTENGETKAVVQAAADFSVGHYSLDSICSYVGDSYE